MHKLIAIFIGCSLALAASAPAAEQVEQVDAKKQSQKPKNVQKQVVPKQQQVKTPKTHVEKVHTDHPNRTLHTDANTNASKKIQKTPVVQSNTLPAVQSKKIEKNKEHLQTTNQQQLQTNTQQFHKNKLDKQTVAKIRAQHHNFHAQANTSIASVKFNQNYRITNAQNWNKPQYQVFKSYQPQWHDQGWWKSHHHHLSLIGGGWYFWDAGYWYPAWGYDEGVAYYPYDGPIYSGPSARPFDQVVADVQAALQEQGYYKGEVDGLLGPLTRQALAEYQSAQGLYATETIDQPTLDSLGLG
jgi:putative peptidoglycan binding protein